MFSFLTRTIWLASLVSMLTDISSEMLYPIMPVYLSTIGFSALWIGMLEGIAEGIVGLSKGYFGNWSDRIGKRLPFVQIGYALSAFSKPMLALFPSTGPVFASRSMDRFGKGIRTAARDALLSDESTIENKGKVFGFHRGMDTFGAALGPLAALLYLYFYPGDYKSLFLFAFIPAMAGVLFTFFINERLHVKQTKQIHRFNPFAYFGYWTKSSSEYKRLVIGLLLFALINSSDLFLLLKMKEGGMSDSVILMIYIFYNLVYALVAFPAGVMADRLGMKTMFSLGLVFFSVAYFLIAMKSGITMCILAFGVYGLYAACAEGVSKAWISNVSERQDTGTAIGLYATSVSVVTTFSSILTGFIWVWFSPALALCLPSLLAIGILIYFQIFIPVKK